MFEYSSSLYLRLLIVLTVNNRVSAHKKTDIMDNKLPTNSYYDQCLGFFLDILKNIEAGVVALDLHEQQIIFSNNYARTILAEMPIDIDFKSLYALFQCELQRLQQKMNHRENKTRIHFKNKVLECTFYNIAGNSRYLCAFLQDITDLSRLDAIDGATEIMNNIGYLFTGIRHEIGNSINSTKMALTVLRNNVNRISPEGSLVYFNRILDEVTKMESLLKSFKSLNMFEKPRTSVIDLVAFIDNFVQLLDADISRRSVNLSLSLSPEARWAKADNRALQQVLLNIMANALDALDGQKKACLEIKSQVARNAVHLSIIDNGCGMSEEMLKNIFKPFYTTKPHGTGLGLIISQKMLSQMNGDIKFSSELNKGSTVTIILPLYAHEEDPSDVG
jgi:nitrogen fixation/metabolism regulation signal transduction histidine kinase